MTSDLLQLLLTVGAVLGILVVGLLAVVPTVMDIPAPQHRPEPQPSPAAEKARPYRLAA